MNTPRFNPEFNPDDPKWTAYILGELNDAERVEIERLLETSSEARALVEELQLAAVTLKEELTPAGAVSLNPEQRAAIRVAAEPAKKKWFSWTPSRWQAALAAAAVVLVAVAVPWNTLRQETVSQVADLSVENLRDERAAAPASEVSSKRESRIANEVAVTSVPVEKNSQVAKDQSDGIAVAPVIPLGNLAAIQEAESAGTGKLAGRTLDVTGALIPGATVSATNQSSGQVKSTVTNGDGTFSLSDLSPGPYRVTASLPGFQTAVNPRQEVRAQETATLDIPLSVSTVSSAVEVVVDAPNGSQDRLRANSGGGGAGQGVGAGVRPGTGTGVPGAVGARLAQAQGAVAAAPPPPPPPPTPPPPSARALESSVAAVRRADEITRVAPNAEAYDRIVDNPFIRASQENFATFSIDVDTASYANVRRFLTQNQRPPRDAVRIEEMINYFSYDYARPSGNLPIAPNMEVASAPWNPANRLVRIGIKARELEGNRRPPSNLVFLIDVSGSMNTPNKLPLLKQGLKLLVDRLGENDMVSIVVYAGASGLVLPPTNGIRKETINQAIDSLYPGGSTNGASGIQLAYNQAVANFIRGGANRVVLMTDGDFNVGITNQGDLTRLIEERAKSGVFLSVLGFGMANIKDATLERLADRGNGNYAYIDNINEARKVLVEEMGGTLVTVAKDVKIQVDFNPGMVEAYRLIGYENRVLRTEDFNNDLKDAGDMGAGHTVTALFEVVPRGGTVPGPSVDPSKYVAPVASDTPRPTVSNSKEMLTLRVRYKQPDGDTSSRMDVPLVDRGGAFNRASSDFRFAASVASFGMILRDSPYRGLATLDWVLDIAEGSRGADRNGYRQEFISLVQRARQLR
jgi:Ca-activated chloride channel family protein